jgi:hypothetical protein
MARITAQEAAEVIRDQQRQLNSAVLPPTLNRIRALMKDETFVICNVGPWLYRLERAALHIVIPGYDPKADTKKKGYAASAPLPCVFREAKLTGGGGEGPLEYSWIEDDGRQVALDMIGVGFGLAPQNSLVQYGVFVPMEGEPTQAEVAAAQRELIGYQDRLIAEARQAFDKSREELGRLLEADRDNRHLWAARARGVDEAWVHHQHTQESVRCDMCGRYNPAGIAKCQCGRILDFELYAKIEKEQAEMMELAQSTRPSKPKS